eukprot:PhF_6_TR15908/c2_g1_i4/m.24560
MVLAKLTLGAAALAELASTEESLELTTFFKRREAEYLQASQSLFIAYLEASMVLARQARAAIHLTVNGGVWPCKFCSSVNSTFDEAAAHSLKHTGLSLIGPDGSTMDSARQAIAREEREARKLIAEGLKAQTALRKSGAPRPAYACASCPFTSDEAEGREHSKVSGHSRFFTGAREPFSRTRTRDERDRGADFTAEEPRRPPPCLRTVPVRLSDGSVSRMDWKLPRDVVTFESFSRYVGESYGVHACEGFVHVSHVFDRSLPPPDHPLGEGPFVFTLRPRRTDSNAIAAFYARLSGMLGTLAADPDDDGRSARLALLMGCVEPNPGPPVAVPQPPPRPQMKQPVFKQPAAKQPMVPGSVTPPPPAQVLPSAPPPEPPPPDLIVQPGTSHEIPQTVWYDPGSVLGCPCVTATGTPCSYTGTVQAMRAHVPSAHLVHGLSFYSSASRTKSVLQHVVDGIRQPSADAKAASAPRRISVLPVWPVPSFDEYVERATIPSLRTVAHAQRDAWRDVVASLAGEYDRATTDAERVQVYHRFLSLPKRYLYRPAAQRSVRGMAKDIRSRLAGVFDPLPQATARPPMDVVKRVEALVREGAFGKAARTLDCDALEPLPPDVQRKLARDLHPTCYVELGELPPRPPDAEVYVDLDDASLERMIRRLPKSAAPGPSGWTRELLIPLLDVPEVLPLLKGLVLGILNGTHSGDLRRFLIASRIIVLTKDGSTLLDPSGRPISMGETFCKVAAYYALDRAASSLHRTFGDLQFGAARSLGVETVVLRSRASFRSHKDWVMLAIDMKNAFNTVARAVLLKALTDQGFRSLYNLVWFLYASPSDLLSGVFDALRSEEGVRQGDVLGPILFALAIHPTLQALRANYPDLEVRAYLDDVTVLGPPTRVAAFFRDFCASMSSAGLVVNRKKCVVSAHSDDALEAFVGLDVKLQREGQKILGAFVAADDDTESRWIMSQRPRIENFLERALEVEPQCAMPLIRSCGLPRWNHFLRCHPPEVTAAANVLVDKSVSHVMQVLLGVEDGVWECLSKNKLFTVDFTPFPGFTALAGEAYATCHAGVFGTSAHSRAMTSAELV